MKRILVALDETPEAASVLAYAIELARPLDAKILLLHVVVVHADLPPPSSLLLALPSSKAELVAAARERLIVLAARITKPLRDDVIVETGSPATVICAVAEARDVDLVVIGAHPHGVLRRMLGTTAARVTDELDRPVLVVRAIGTRVADVRGSYAATGNAAEAEMS